MTEFEFDILNKWDVDSYCNELNKCLFSGANHGQPQSTTKMKKKKKAKVSSSLPPEDIKSAKKSIEDTLGSAHPKTKQKTHKKVHEEEQSESFTDSKKNKLHKKKSIPPSIEKSETEHTTQKSKRKRKKKLKPSDSFTEEKKGYSLKQSDTSENIGRPTVEHLGGQKNKKTSNRKRKLSGANSGKEDKPSKNVSHKKKGVLEADQKHKQKRKGKLSGTDSSKKETGGKLKSALEKSRTPRRKGSSQRKREMSDSNSTKTEMKEDSKVDQKDKQKHKRKLSDTVNDQEENTNVSSKQNNVLMDSQIPQVDGQKKKRKKNRKRKRLATETGMQEKQDVSHKQNGKLDMSEHAVGQKHKKRRNKRKRLNSFGEETLPTKKQKVTNLAQQTANVCPKNGLSNTSTLPFNIDVLKKMLEKDCAHKIEQEKRDESYKKTDNSLHSMMTDKLQSARFRYLNEELYTKSGAEAKKMFKEDPFAFKVYHEGYQHQVSRWPLKPLEIIINDLKKKPKDWIIADFGCGDALLSRTLANKVHSFDLVALNEYVTECDMAHTPLASESVDVAVFCLSLMGTNLRDYLKEANRVLKESGILKIAEVVSRIDNTEEFVSTVEKFGFASKFVDTANIMFCLFDFKKTSNVRKKKKLPFIQLKPCLYKKR